MKDIYYSNKKYFYNTIFKQDYRKLWHTKNFNIKYKRLKLNTFNELVITRRFTINKKIHIYFDPYDLKLKIKIPFKNNIYFTIKILTTSYFKVYTQLNDILLLLNMYENNFIPKIKFTSDFICKIKEKIHYNFIYKKKKLITKVPIDFFTYHNIQEYFQHNHIIQVEDNNILMQEIIHDIINKI